MLITETTLQILQSAGIVCEQIDRNLFRLIFPDGHWEIGDRRIIIQHILALQNRIPTIEYFSN